VPVLPKDSDKPEEPAEVLQTIRKGRESDLVVGSPSGPDSKRAAEIS